MAGLLRICTAGSVDDGKSTLIGRLLYDSRAVYEDQVRSVRVASKNRTAGAIDFSLFTDGLKAEREQGITIDVAYRYFATARRTFILADTPGHEQYTRNMATGASTADVAVLLIDARHGVREQSQRHARIARLLGISRFVLAVNKMDLVGFSSQVFDAVRCDFLRLPAIEQDGALVRKGDRRAPIEVRAIPTSALDGDNIVSRSARMPWYDGPSLLKYLEDVDIEDTVATGPFRFPVQLVLRPDDRFRGYAGQIAGGTIRPGDRVTIHPSGRRTTVRRIVTYDGDLPIAHAPMSVALVLDDDVDVSRGDLVADGSLDAASALEADLVWMDERPLVPGRLYLVKHLTQTVTAEFDRPAGLNEIVRVTATASRPLVFDGYRDNRSTGSFIVIDPATKFTCGAGMIVAAVRDHRPEHSYRPAAERLAALARRATTDADAVNAIRQALEEMLI